MALGMRSVVPGRPGVGGAVRCGVALAAAALGIACVAQAAYGAQSAVTGTVAAAYTGTAGLSSAELAVKPLADRLYAQYQQEETATQTYDGLMEQLGQAQAKDTQLTRQTAALQQQVDDDIQVAGAVAAAEYRSQDVSQLSTFLLARNPREATDLLHLLEQAARNQAAFIHRLKSQQSALASDKAQADATLARVTALTAAAAKQKANVQKELAATEKAVASLTGAQRQLIEQLELHQADQAQLAFLASGALGSGSTKPSAEGAAAVAYAFQQLGKPYLWGGNGPDAFDCSGLTQQSWLHAGVTIPRTSQEQWAQLTHVQLDALRPGDLILYFAGATHVALYIGGGLVIEAPHTGSFVEVEPIAVDPILGAVRPDPAQPSLGSYTAPAIPSSQTGLESLGGSSGSSGSSDSTSTTKPAPIPTLKPTPVPTPTPKPSASAKPSASPSASASASASPSASASVTPSAAASTSPSASATH